MICHKFVTLNLIFLGIRDFERKYGSLSEPLRENMAADWAMWMEEYSMEEVVAARKYVLENSPSWPTPNDFYIYCHRARYNEDMHAPIEP